MYLRKRMINLPKTLAFRFTLRYALAFVGFIVMGFVVLYMGIATILNYEMDEDLQEDVAELRALYRSEGLERLKSEIDREVKPGEEDSLFIRLLDSSGQIIHTSDVSSWPPLEVKSDVLRQLISSNESVLLSRQFDEQEYETRIIYGVISDKLIINIGESFEEKQDLLEIIQQVLISILVLAIPLASLLSWLMARKAVRGIEEVIKTAEQIKLGQLDQRVTIQSKDYEVQTLVSTFNAMLERIDALITEMRDITDNIAHDLKSPLARIRAISEEGISKIRTPEDYRVAAADIIEECDRLLQMINTALDVAEAEAGISHNPVSEVNVSELVSDACELFHPVAEEKSIELKCRINSDCKLQGNVPNLQRMLANLLDNAIKYTPEKGYINLELICTHAKITIAVADTGTGIPEHEQGRIFERFYRCDQSRSADGCGMGLSFARAVARAHGGDIFVKSTPGMGSVFTVEINSDN